MVKCIFIHYVVVSNGAQLLFLTSNIKILPLNNPTAKRFACNSEKATAVTPDSVL